MRHRFAGLWLIPGGWYQAGGLALVIAAAVLLGPATAWAQLSPNQIEDLRRQGEREGWTFTVGESEATRRPLSELTGAVEPPDWRVGAPVYQPEPNRSLPGAFDWRYLTGCTPIKNQGGCGSCWAFGAIGAVEQSFLINNGITVDLSEQWLVSCTTAGDCGGGWHTQAFDFLSCDGEFDDACGGYGAVLETGFPYVAWNAPCNCPYEHPYCLDTWGAVSANVNSIKQAIMEFGPVTTTVYVSGAFHAYDEGVFNACATGPLNHCVVLVGWDDSQGSEGVWILRNSWSPGWGEDGYMRIEYGCNLVGSGTAYVVTSMEDCNGDTLPDRYNLTSGMSADCNSNSRPDECDIADGLSQDCNGNDMLDECDLDAFATNSPWSAYDPSAEGMGYQVTGFKGAVFDGRYVYFVPAIRVAGPHGTVLRYDTNASFSNLTSWSSFDAGDHGVGTDPDGYQLAVFDGRYIYFCPRYNGTDLHGEVLRYDTAAEFQEPSSWATFDAAAQGVGVTPRGYVGGVFDGRYVYFAPDFNGIQYHGEVLRFDTLADFQQASSWATFNPADQGVGNNPEGYRGAVCDGRYVYFVPYQNSLGYHGEVLRYDTSADFQQASSWATFDAEAQGVGNAPVGYYGAAFDGRFVYFAPKYNGTAASGEVLRLDTTSNFGNPSSWRTFDTQTEGVGINAVGYYGACYDGEHVYFVPYASPASYHGEVLRLDPKSDFGDPASWASYDAGAHGVGDTPGGYHGAAFDGQYLYFAPDRNLAGYSGEVLRYDVTYHFSSDCNWNLVPDECDAAIVSADGDSDGDVDLDDYLMFTSCLGGPQTPPASADCEAACLAAFDFDDDDDVDFDDFAEFQAVSFSQP